MPYFKKILICTLSVLTALSLAACDGSQKFVTQAVPFGSESKAIEPSSKSSADEALPKISGAEEIESSSKEEAAKPFTKLTVIFTSGAGKDPAQKGIIPISQIVGLKKSLEMNGEEVILVDTGGSFWGTPFTITDSGALAAKLLTECGYSVSALSSSDFNLSPKKIKEISDNVSLKIMCSNFIKVKENQPFSKGGVIINKGGKKIGILAFTPTETAAEVSPINLKGGVFEASPSILQLMVDNIKNNGADYVIALTSLNKNSELSPITLAEEIKGLDLIIGQGGGNPAASAVHEGDTLVVYGDSTLKSVGMAEIDLNSKTAGVQSYTIESSVLSANDDRDTALALEKIIAEQEAAQKDIICQLAFPDKESDNNRENAIGSMAAAAIRPITGAEAAIVLEDLWVGVPLDGIISMEKLFKGVDESSLAVTVNLTGAEIKALLEESLSAFNEEGITPIYFNGLGFKGNIKGEKGSRISEITINGEAADLNKTYLIALDSRLLGEDSEYSSLKNSKAINSYGLLSEAIMRYMRAFEKNGKLEIGINKAVAYGGEENPPTAPIKKEEPKKSEEPKNSAPPRAEEKIPPREEKPPTAKEKTYTVKMGDTLTKISKSIYGTIEYWDEIYNANRDVLKNSEDIRVGMVLRLPA